MNTQSQYPTAENRKSQYQYSDPLILNFKLLIEFDGMEGLFGDESYPNTALAFLKRIGEDERYEMLKHLILMYKNFTKNLDFLVKSVEGLDRISNVIPAQMFGYDEDKLTINTDETLDMYVMSIIQMYREICYDLTARKVTILPYNLQHFNCNILVFASGYFSEDYDKAEPDENGVEDTDIMKRVLPTKKKLFYGESNEFISKLHESYNHTIFRMEGCEFKIDECGKAFFAEVTNEPTDTVTKNNLTFSYKSAHFSGRFNNLTGDRDITKLLFESALANKQTNIAQENKLTVQSIKESLNNAGTSVYKQSATKLRATGVQKVHNIFGVNMTFPPVQDFTLDRAFERAGNKLFDMGLSLSERETRELQGSVTKMFANNFSNQLLNGFIVPVASSATLFPNTPLPTAEPLNAVSMLPPQQPYVVTDTGSKLASTARFPVEESSNKTKLFF